MAAKAWTDKEIATLKKLWGKKTTSQIAVLMGRTSDSIGAQGRKLKLGASLLPKGKVVKPTPKHGGKPVVIKTPALPAQKKIKINPADGEPLIKDGAIKGKAFDLMMSKALVTPEPTLTVAFEELSDAIGTLLEALKNKPLTKPRATITLMAHNLLEALDKHLEASRK